MQSYMYMYLVEIKKTHTDAVCARQATLSSRKLNCNMSGEPHNIYTIIQKSIDSYDLLEY